LATPGSLADTLAMLVGRDGLVLVSERAPGPQGEPPAPGVVSSRPTLGLLEALRDRGVDARLGTVAALGGPDNDPRAAAQSFRDAGAAITGTLLGIASLGTVAIAPRGGNDGLLACLPPHHVAILREQDIVADLGAAFVRLGEVLERDRGEFVFVTGPSRTADIEMMTVLGVHGPLRLDVVVVCGDAEPYADAPGVGA
jgi:LUD domain